jgi:hypothetical protein
MAQQQFPARFVFAEQAYRFDEEAAAAAELGPLYVFTVTWNGEAGAPPGAKLSHDELVSWMSATESAGNTVGMEKAPPPQEPEPEAVKSSKEA